MSTRILAAGFAVASVAYACAPHTPDGERGVMAATVLGARQAATTSAVQASVFAVSRDAGLASPRAAAPTSDSPMRGELIVRDGSPRMLVLAVTNSGGKVAELRFPDGQTHEFVLRDVAGRDVWRWSAGRLFTQALRTRPVDGGETVEFAEPLRGGVPRGTYTVVAQLRSDNHPIEVRRAIVLP